MWSVMFLTYKKKWTLTESGQTVKKWYKYQLWLSSFLKEWNNRLENETVVTIITKIHSRKCIGNFSMLVSEHNTCIQIVTKESKVILHVKMDGVLTNVSIQRQRWQNVLQIVVLWKLSNVTGKVIHFHNLFYIYPPHLWFVQIFIFFHIEVLLNF